MINLLKFIFVLNTIQNNFADILHIYYFPTVEFAVERRCVSNVKFDITIVPFEINPTY